MPRPPVKRTKLAGTGPSLRVASSQDVLRSSLSRPNLPNNAKRLTQNGSDDSDGLVVAIPGLKNRRGIARKEVLGSGGLGVGDVKDAHKQTRRGREESQAGQSPGRKTELPSLKMKRDAVLKAQQDAANLASSVSPDTSTKDRPPTRGKRMSTTDSAANSQTDLGVGAHGTLGFESSALANFKRRARQPSILQMAQRNESHHIDDDDLADFLPDDQSTPFNLSKSKSVMPRSGSALSASTSQTGVSRKRKLSSAEIQVPQSQPAIVQESPVSSPSVEAAADESNHSEVDLPLQPPAGNRKHAQTTVPEIWSDTMAPPVSSSSPDHSPKKPRPVDSVSKTKSKSASKARAKNIDAQAPKRSSAVQNTNSKSGTKSSVPPKVSTAMLQSLLPHRRQRRPHRHYKTATDFDIPDDSELEEVEDDHLGEIEPGEDELSAHAPIRKPEKRGSRSNARNGVLGPTTKPAAKNQKTKTKSRENVLQTFSTPKSNSISPLKMATARAAAKSSQQQGRTGKTTYSSRGHHGAEGDKENRPFDTSSSLSSAPTTEGLASDEGGAHLEASKEMREMAKKFAVVDDYEMEFEDVTISGSGSSPPIGR